ncbi:DUF3208 family protein [Deinococcus radiopugnans]|uniref:DUF3208 family protein n=1 Tax=Deinococcus radiopugnans TaxID=57497 RepID=UPI00361DA934
MLWGVSPTEPQAGGRAAIRLLQGYIWHAQDADIDLEHFLPRELDLPTPPAWPSRKAPMCCGTRSIRRLPFSRTANPPPPRSSTSSRC